MSAFSEEEKEVATLTLALEWSLPAPWRRCVLCSQHTLLSHGSMSPVSGTARSSSVYLGSESPEHQTSDATSYERLMNGMGPVG